MMVLYPKLRPLAEVSVMQGQVEQRCGGTFLGGGRGEQGAGQSREGNRGGLADSIVNTDHSVGWGLTQGKGRNIPLLQVDLQPPPSICEIQQKPCKPAVPVQVRILLSAEKNPRPINLVAKLQTVSLLAKLETGC